MAAHGITGWKPVANKETMASMKGIGAETATGTQTSTTLLEAVAAGNSQAHGRQFVERYGPMVRAIALTSKVSINDTDDIIQEVMLAAVEALRRHRYDRQRGRFKPWIKAVIYHKISDARQEKGTEARRHEGNRNSPYAFRYSTFRRPRRRGRSPPLPGRGV
jgi:DNA-directed RNA polymerase specialized sigma24 family protein